MGSSDYVGLFMDFNIYKITETKKNNEIHKLLEIDFDFFRGKKVVVFDDICTSGNSSETFVRLLEEAGAIVKLTMFLAKTKTYRR